MEWFGLLRYQVRRVASGTVQRQERKGDSMHKWEMSRAWLLAVVLASALRSADPSGFEVRIQVRDAKGKEFAGPSKALCEEWYPKINAALFGQDYVLPFKEVKIIFEPSIWLGTGPRRTVIPAYTKGDTIHVNSGYVARLHEKEPADYRGMLIHELTHVNQHYGDDGGAGWLTEGIADYVRHKYFEKDIEPRLHLDSNGNLQGFELDRNKGVFATEGYLAGYTVTAAFLFWLEVWKDKDIVAVLNRALREGRYSAGLFRERCGAPLGALWAEFVAASRV
jgi:hypothetical protein